MQELVEYERPNEFGKRLKIMDQDKVRFRHVYNQSDAEPMRPISININVNRESDNSKDKPSFNIFKSKIALLLLTLAISLGMGYARTRYICQGFKDSGRFYYGMDVNRCVGILIKEPFANLEQQLSTINVKQR